MCNHRWRRLQEEAVFERTWVGGLTKEPDLWYNALQEGRYAVQCRVYCRGSIALRAPFPPFLT